jgi:hypothetical protein
MPVRICLNLHNKRTAWNRLIFKNILKKKQGDGAGRKHVKELLDAVEVKAGKAGR